MSDGAEKRKIRKHKGEFTYRGYTLEELKQMPLKEFAQLLPARQRRKLLRGLTPLERKLLQKIKAGKSVRTHLRWAIVLPEMVGAEIEIHDGKKFNKVKISPEMIGRYLGEFALTRKRVIHGAAGIGATRSSKYIPLK